jgi:hypothetical protein
MLRPAHAQHTTRAFSSWIGTVVDESQATDLKQELEKLRASGADIYKLMRHASQLMSKGNKEVKLPLNDTDANGHGSEQILHVLIQQWNHYQTGNGMANVPPPEITKTPVSITVDKYGSTVFSISFTDAVPNKESLTEVENRRHRVYSPQMDPMSMGIAIGAP